MEQTRGNYYKMMGFGIAVITAGAVTAVYLLPLWKTFVPVPQGRENLYKFIPIVLSLCAAIGGIKGALTVQAHLLPKCEMNEEERQRIQKYSPEARRTFDRALMGMAALCVVVLLCNLF